MMSVLRFAGLEGFINSDFGILKRHSRQRRRVLDP
jgi:hypothetical protein